MNPYEHILQHLSQNIMVITPNNRLARILLAHAIEEKHAYAMEKPPIFSYAEFLQHLFLEVKFQNPTYAHPVLIAPIHLRKIWSEILGSTEIYPITEGLIQAFIQAWKLAHTWLVDLEDDAFEYAPQHTLFKQLALKVNALLSEKNLITEEQLPTYLQHFIPNLAALKNTVWFCFDDYTPAQKILQSSLEKAGYSSLKEDIPHTPFKASYQLCLKETKDEYDALCQWIEAHPNQHLGIVIPTIETEAQSITRLLSDALGEIDFNISFSRPLSCYPLAAHGLTWIQLKPDQIITQHERDLLFYSPYLVSTRQERHTRARWRQSTSFLTNDRLAWSYFLKNLPDSSLKTGLQQITPYPQNATISEWIILFERRLKQIGFPGEADLDSGSYQCFQRFISLFDEFRTLHLLTDRLSQEEAIELFVKLADGAMFQPERPTSQVQILGLLEASGCKFDHLWMMHMTDQHFPQQGQCTAFIPMSIQKKLDMPHANHQRDMQYASQIFRRLIDGSLSQHFSYSKFNQDTPCLPSPFLNDLPSKTVSLTPPILTHKREQIEAQYHYPLQPNERFRGGTALLSNQAKCPFRAFAAHRLHLKKDEMTSEGLNPRERGQILHLVLEKLWQQLESQTKLLATSEEELSIKLDAIILEVLAPFETTHQYTFPTLVQTLELTRLKKLALVCLDFEKKRPSFEIEALEKNAEITLSNLTFHVKLDRLDRLSTGEKWVIDYKTRLPSQKPWHEDRPEEPQLLLYALLDKSIHGMMFIELSRGKIDYAGFAKESTLPGIQSPEKESTWEMHQAHWHQQLTQLAEEFEKGHCAPKPVRSAICNLCEFKPLCRFEMS